MKKLIISLVSLVMVFSWGFSQETIIEYPELKNTVWDMGRYMTQRGNKIVSATMNKSQKVEMLMLNENLEVEWHKEVFGGTGQTGPSGLVWSNAENCFYLGGSGLWDNQWKGFLVKLDSLGNLIQETFVYPDTYEVFLTDFVVSEKNIFAIGSANSQHPIVGNSYIFCLNHSLEEVWEIKKLKEAFQKIVKTETGIVVFGYSFPEGQNYIMKLDLSGNIIWKKDYNSVLQIYNAISTNNETLITGKNYDLIVFLKKFDSQGNVLWEKEFNLRPGFKSWGVAIFPLEDGSGDYILIANCGERVAICETHAFRLNQNGDLCWERIYSGGSSCGLYDSTGNLILAGRTNENIPKILLVYQDITPVGFEKSAPAEFRLEQNYPNPFNATTNIRFQLANEVNNVSVIVYNILGNKVRSLVQNEKTQAGYYTVEWDGINDAGQVLSSGTYLYCITAGSFSATKKMVLIK